MITHEEAKIASMLTTVEATRTMIDYISQQEKKDELLELYKRIETDIPTKMLKRIRELEKELEELK